MRSPWPVQQVYDQYKATGLGAWYLSMTTLPPHNAGVPGAASSAGGRGPRETAKATVQARNDMQVRLPWR